MKQLELPTKIPMYYVGPSLHEPAPTLLYLALSAKESLCVDPFNHPAGALIKRGWRVISVDLPFHGEEFDSRLAMDIWYDTLQKTDFLTPFLEDLAYSFQYILTINPTAHSCIATAGLSRGAFIATHIAGYLREIKAVLGFAPLTKLHKLDEFQSYHSVSFAHLNLSHLAPKLIQKTIRFYIGNNDSRVSTAECFQFLTTLVQEHISHNIRTIPVEMVMYPSIGYKGHGTPPEIFESGVQWLDSYARSQ